MINSTQFTSLDFWAKSASGTVNNIEVTWEGNCAVFSLSLSHENCNARGALQFS